MSTSHWIALMALSHHVTRSGTASGHDGRRAPESFCTESSPHLYPYINTVYSSSIVQFPQQNPWILEGIKSLFYSHLSDFLPPTQLWTQTYKTKTELTWTCQTEWKQLELVINAWECHIYINLTKTIEYQL